MERARWLVKSLVENEELPSDVEILRAVWSEESEELIALLWSRKEEKYYVVTEDYAEYHVYEAKLLL